MDAKLTPLDRLRKVQEALACAELFTCKNAHQQSAGKVLTIIKDSQALIPSLMVDLSWKTIDSAPRDRTPILGYSAEGVMYVCWYQNEKWCFFDDGNGNILSWLPNHWMHLPKPLVCQI